MKKFLIQIEVGSSRPREDGPHSAVVQESIVVQSTSTTTSGKIAMPTPEAVEVSAGEIFDRAFGEAGTTRAAAIVAFQGIVSELPRGAEREDRLRDVSKAAILSTARSHGNIIETGRALLGNIDELGVRLMLDVPRCKDQMLLGLAEGACQVGPIVYGRFLDIAGEYRDNADDWISRNKRRSESTSLEALPVIVPFENSLTLNARPFAVGLNIQSSTNPPTPASPPPPPPLNMAAMAGLTEVRVEPPRVEPPTLLTPEVPQEPQQQETAPEHPPVEPTPADAPPEPPTTWSRPKGKGFFRRLSDVMAGLFGRA